jgi:hypothetical protein
VILGFREFDKREGRVRADGCGDGRVRFFVQGLGLDLWVSYERVTYMHRHLLGDEAVSYGWRGLGCLICDFGLQVGS